MTASNTRTRQTAFTLVELLVVIGIIAILVGVLLPSLASARRSAQTIKCSSALSQIANCYKLYSIDNKGFYPPMRCASTYQVLFAGNPPSVNTANQTYWMYFFARYVTHSALNAASGGATAQDQAMAMASVLWGCPNFVPVQSTNAAISNNGIAMVYTGYGMNGYPEYTPTFPAVSGNQYDVIGDSSLTPTNSTLVSTVSVGPSGTWKDYTGKWYKYSAYTRPAERALVADTNAYVLEAMKATSTTAIAGQATITALSSGIFWIGAPDPGQSTYDYYRHGKYPGLSSTANQLNATGGKVGYNVMYADGHVVTLQTREEGFLAARMRFPG